MLHIKSISKTFGKGSVNENKVINDLALYLHKGEFVTVIGSNGAGKSTLLNCISGVCDVDNGQILLDSTDVTSVVEYKRAKYIGRIFQDPLKGTAYNMTIEENMALSYVKNKSKGLKFSIKKNDRGFFKEQLSLLNLGLEDRMDQKIGSLSGGQRQAVTLLMATMTKPKLLLLDEHTAALDPEIAQKVLQITNTIVNKQKICTLMITHNMKEALDYGSRTIMMHQGKIVLDIKGRERESMTVDKLIQQFGNKGGSQVYSDRMLL